MSSNPNEVWGDRPSPDWEAIGMYFDHKNREEKEEKKSISDLIDRARLEVKYTDYNVLTLRKRGMTSVVLFFFRRDWLFDTYNGNISDRDLAMKSDYVIETLPDDTFKIIKARQGKAQALRFLADHLDYLAK